MRIPHSSRGLQATGMPPLAMKATDVESRIVRSVRPQSEPSISYMVGGFDFRTSLRSCTRPVPVCPTAIFPTTHPLSLHAGSCGLGAGCAAGARGRKRKRPVAHPRPRLAAPLAAGLSLTCLSARELRSGASRVYSLEVERSRSWAWSRISRRHGE